LGAIRRVELPPGSPKFIALTFDLCEQPNEIAGYDGAIVDVLRRLNVNATFFSGGKWLQTHKDQAQQLMADPLFELGNHTWEHRNLRVIENPDALRDEIEGTQLAYEEIWNDLEGRRCLTHDEKKFAHEHASRRLSLFRFPFGACSPASLAAVANQGLHAIQWDVSSGDSSPGFTTEQIAGAVVASVRPGSIVLFHANGRGWKTARALPLIIDALRDKGFVFVTVSTLIRLPGAKLDIRPICFDSKPGDTNRYDLFARGLLQTYKSFTDRLNADRATFPTSKAADPPSEAAESPKVVPPKPVPRPSRFPPENP
jgi:peptidoglycan/xylan/chitin deacetylase (PgdA/CDA1 family)